MSEYQHFNVKLFAEGEPEIDWHALIPVFHRWIQKQSLPGLLIDVADYAHVPAGPGVMLIGHDAFWSVDNRENRLGFLYNRRTVTNGGNASRLRDAFESALLAARKLESEPEFVGKVRFSDRQLEVTVNDRLLAPNTDATWAELQPAFKEVFTNAEFKRVGAERELFRVRVQTP